MGTYDFATADGSTGMRWGSGNGNGDSVTANCAQPDERPDERPNEQPDTFVLGLRLLSGATMDVGACVVRWLQTAAFTAADDGASDSGYMQRFHGKPRSPYSGG